jgi:hypothetical protein
MVKGEEEVLSFDPVNRAGKLICKQLNEDGVCMLLTQRWVIPVVLLPILENFVEAGR